MSHAYKKMSVAAAVLAVAALMGWAMPARALQVIGRWDPAFGAPFNTAGSVLGWQGTAEWFLPDACVPGSGVVLNSAACSAGGMRMVGATVEFYNFSLDPLGNNPLATLSFGPASASVLSMNVAGSSVLGVNTSLTAALTPSSSFAGIGDYSFALQFAGGDVRLYYARNGQTQSFATAAGAYSGTSQGNAYGGGTGGDGDCDDHKLHGNTDHGHKHCEPKPPCVVGEIAAPNCGVNDPRSPARVSFTTTVPEPPTFALMLAALGMTGLMARGRRRARQTPIAT